VIRRTSQSVPKVEHLKLTAAIEVVVRQSRDRAKASLLDSRPEEFNGIAGEIVEENLSAANARDDVGSWGLDANPDQV
jgi:hypothetical protein